MKLALVSIGLAAALPAAAQSGYGIRREPAPAPRTTLPEPSPPASRPGWDDPYAQRKADWDRQLNACLNDRRQKRLERRRCADMGMPGTP